MGKRLISLLLAVVLVLSLAGLPAAFAVEDDAASAEASAAEGVTAEEETTETPSSDDSIETDSQTEASEETAAEPAEETEEEIDEEPAEETEDAASVAETETSAAETTEETAAEPAQEAEETAATVEYNATDGDVSVTVTAQAGALPDGAVLSVSVLDENSDEYAAAAEAIDYDADDEDTGMAALDISFIVGETEVEPSEAVTVSIDVSSLLPDDADASTIEVQHLEETASGDVEATLVADATDDTDGTVDEETAVAEFEVESFSSFTITWSTSDWWDTTTYFIITVYHVDENGNSLEADTEDVTLNRNNDNVSQTCTFSDYAAEIDGYTYSKAVYSSVTGSEVTTATFTATTSGYGYGQTTTRTLAFYNNGTQVGDTLTYSSTQTATVYLVYTKLPPAVSITASGSDAAGYGTHHL